LRRKLPFQLEELNRLLQPVSGLKWAFAHFHSLPGILRAVNYFIADHGP
jgi:hypothetical protein